jgi:hypothetical protein
MGDPAVSHPNDQSAIIGDVKKLLLIFLFLTLPIQYSWAAAAVYCQHDQSHSSHFGHHSHHHQAQSDKLEKSDSKNKLLKVDNDCGYCHLSCHALPQSVSPNLDLPNVSLPHIAQAPPFTSFFPEGPKRPIRALVA